MEGRIANAELVSLRPGDKIIFTTTTKTSPASPPSPGEPSSGAPLSGADEVLIEKHELHMMVEERIFLAPVDVFPDLRDGISAHIPQGESGFRTILEMVGVENCLPGLSSVDEGVAEYEKVLSMPSRSAAERAGKSGIVAVRLVPWAVDTS